MWGGILMTNGAWFTGFTLRILIHLAQTKTWQEIPVEISERVICFTHSLFEDCRYFPSVAEFQISQ